MVERTIWISQVFGPIPFSFLFLQFPGGINPKMGQVLEAR